MNNGAEDRNPSDRTSSESASPEARRWAARREEARASAEADHQLALKAQAEQRRRLEQENHGPLGIYIGLVVAALLFAIGWVVLDRMRCDPFYAGISFSGRHACQ